VNLENNVLANNRTVRFCKVLSVISHIILFFGSIGLAFLPCLFSGSGRIPLVFSMIWAMIVFAGLICYYLSWMYSSSQEFQSKQQSKSWVTRVWSTIKRSFRICAQTNRKRILIPSTLLFALAIFMPLATAGLCISTFSDKYGYYWLEVRRVSSTFTRWFDIKKVCPPGAPCHIYTTVPEDTATGFFLNVHTHTDVQEITVLYQERESYETDGPDMKEKKGEMYNFKGVEELGKRNVHSVYIDGLKEGTEYYLEIYYEDGIKYAEKYYKTLPGPNSKEPVKIAMGGDVGSNYTVKYMNDQIAKEKPDILVIAGDAGYDEGLTTCYYSFDLFLWYFEDMYDQIGRLVPFVIGIGNHDIGYNALANPTIESNEEGPMFYLFLPQHLPRNSQGEIEQRVPALHEREPYFYHIVGNTLQLSLDSGYIAPYDGKQKAWITETVMKHANLARFANYHVPVYASCFKPLYDDDRAPLLAEKHWLPLFEELKFMTAFENHVHFYKRTKPLIQGKEHPKGVLYLGDGAWGILPNVCREPNKPRRSELYVHEKAESLNHVWIVTMNQTVVKYEALGMDGKLIEDPFYQRIDDYKLDLPKANANAGAGK